MLTAEAFWNKAKLNLEIAFRYRNSEDNAMFQFWATVSLELLGKACLANAHPVYVVNPEDFKSLRIACGDLESIEYKTITAKTVYDRLNKVVDGFDSKAESFCNKMAYLRNEELHSGALAFEGIDLRSWQQQYWRVVKLLCEEQDRSLEQLIGDEAPAAEKIIADAKAAIEVAVAGRIKKAGSDFKLGKNPTTLKTLVESSRELARQQRGETDAVAECPACGCLGVLRGNELDEEYIEHMSDEFGMARMRLYCEAEEFKCTICNLWLSGQEQISLGGLPEDFEAEVYREYEWEPDYGND